MKVTALDGKGDLFELFEALFLEWSGCPDSGIERQVVGFSIGWTGLDIAAPLAVGAGVRTASSLAAGDAV